MTRRIDETRRRSGLLALLLAVLSLLAVPGFAQTALDRYVEQGLAQNLALQQQQIDLAQSMQALEEARGLFYPSLDIEARYSRAGGGRTIDFPVGDLLNPVYGTLNEMLIAQGRPGTFPQLDNVEIDFLRTREQNTQLRITQPLYQPQIRHNVRLQRSLIGVQEASVEAYRNTLVKEIKTAYYAYVKAFGAAEIYANTLALVHENERVNERLVQASLATHDAVLRARTEVLAIEQQIADAQRERDLARSYLNFLLNRPLDTPIEYLDPAVQLERESLDLLNVRLASTAATPVSQLSDLQMRALDQRAELDQLRAATAASQTATKLAQSAYLPSVNLALDLGIQGTDYGFAGDRSYYMGSVVLRWNVFNGFQTRSRVEQQRLSTQRLEAQREELQQQIRLQVQEAYDQAMVAYSNAIRTAEERVQTARAMFRLVTRKYAEGLAPQVDFLDARTTLTTAELNLNITRADALIRLAELEHAVGAR